MASAENVEKVAAALEHLMWDPDFSLDDDVDEAARYFNNVGLRLLNRFNTNDQKGGIRSLNQAILLLRSAVAHPSSLKDSGRAMFIANLSDALCRRAELLKSKEDSQEAVEWAKKAFGVLEGWEYFSRVLDNYANATQSSFALTRYVDNLNQFIRDCMEELDSVLRSDLKAHTLQKLAEAFETRHESGQESADLDSAVEYARKAVEQTGNNHATELYKSCINTLATCLLARYKQCRLDSDVTEAINLGTQSIMGVKDLETLAIRLNNLATCYWAKARYGKQSERNHNIEQSISTAGEAYTIATSEVGLTFAPSCKAAILSNFGLCLQERSEIETDMRSFDDLNRSISLGYEALNLSSPDAINRANLMSNLAARLQRASLYSSQQDPRPSTRSSLSPHANYTAQWVKLLSESMRLDHANPNTRIAGVLTAISFLEENVEKIAATKILGELSTPLKDAVELMLQMTKSSLLHDKKATIAQYYGLARYAAVAALEAGCEVYEALRRLEIGRGILISMQLNVRADLTDLKARFPQLAQRYRHVHEEIAALEDRQGNFESRHAMGVELDKLLAEIRSQSGFGDFEQPLSKKQMMDLACEGPIVALIVTKLRSDAIIVTPDSISSVPLSDFDLDAMETMTLHIHQRLAANEAQRSDKFLDLHMDLVNHLSNLWEVLSRILDKLAYNRPHERGKPWPRIWWVPTGAFVLLPLHAAASRSGRKMNVMDRVISSYTPTIKALANSRSSRPDAPNDFALVFSMSETPGMADLSFSDAEFAAIQSTVAHYKIFHNPVRGEVLSALRNKPSIVHFRCHGETNAVDPSLSMLLFADWQSNPLTVGDIEKQRLPNGALAYLSACYAAHSGGVELLLDESIHLASAFQIAGFSCVVGSLWAVREADSKVVVEKFYERLANPNSDSKVALHEAIIILRNETRKGISGQTGEPLRWAPFIHFGA